MRKLARTFSVQVLTPSGTIDFPKELKYEFSVDSLEAKPGRCTLRIFNAKDGSLGNIYVGSLLTLKAGYEEQTDTIIFQGQVTNYFQFRQGPDIVTEVYCADWGHSFNADCNKTYSDSDTLDNIIAHVAGSMKKTIKSKQGTGGADVDIFVTATAANIKIGDIGETRPSGLQIPTGTCTKYLQYLSYTYGFYWWIKNGIFFARSTDPEIASSEESTATNISASTGMLSTPIITPRGVDVVTLMEPQLTVSSIFIPSLGRSTINIADKFYAPLESFKERKSWLQRVHRIVHKGDTRGNQWQTQLTGMHVYVGST